MKQNTACKSRSAESLFIKYVSQNILGMIGISAYVLADTFFISRAEGADGITALNLVLPLYSLIFAIGNMIGIGSATRFRILRAQKKESADLYFSNAVLFALAFSLIFILAGICIPHKIVVFLGGDARITEVGTPYTRIFLCFAPFFMWNYIFNAFVRNDGNTSIAMAATLFSSLFNIVMDYVLMFPLGMGMSGAALATAISPIVGICICSLHFLGKKNSIRFVPGKPSIKRLAASCQLGISAFIGEMSSGVTTIVFNFLILRIAGNIGVAAYGVVANTAIVANSIFNGIAQGSQPLFSEFYGRRDLSSVKKVLRMSAACAVALAVLLLLSINLFAGQITDVFNSEKNPEMAAYAITGLRLYFTGFLFAGFNIAATGYFSATAAARQAFLCSILRGFAAIIVCAFVLSALFKMTGVWLAFPAAELITLFFILYHLRAGLRA